VWTEPDVKRLLDAEGAGLPGEGGDRVPVSSLFCRCGKMICPQALSPLSLSPVDVDPAVLVVDSPPVVGWAWRFQV